MGMSPVFVSCLVLAASPAPTPLATTRATVPADAMVVVTVDVEDVPASDISVAALDVHLDGAEDNQLLLFRGSGRGSYDVLLGPLRAGDHVIEVRPSARWPWPRGARVNALHAAVVDRDRPDYARLRWSPRIGLRADTIGTRNDLPLLLYVEALGDGAARLRYSAVFSNEDGGTPARALMARWGRTTDIEWVTEIDTRSTSVYAYQGIDHATRHAATGRGAPTVVVATASNNFRVSGASGAFVRMVPRAVALEGAPREATMDAEPWIYRLMAAELAAENKIDAGAGAGRGTVADPRHYAFAEARVRLRRARVAARVEVDDGRWLSSHGGLSDLAVARDGWVRVAVEIGRAQPRRVAWECLPAQGRRDDGGCEIEATRLFRLEDDYRPGANLAGATPLSLRTGEMAVAGPASRGR